MLGGIQPQRGMAFQVTNLTTRQTYLEDVFFTQEDFVLFLLKRHDSKAVLFTSVM